MKIKTEDVSALLDCIAQYFTSINAPKPDFGVPYNLDTKTQKQPLYEYTGHIGITGSHKGGMVITCAKEMVQEVLHIVLGAEDSSIDDLEGMIAEVANTIAGNARVHFGSGFDISVPTVVIGFPEEIKFQLAEPTLVIPMTWKGHAANAIIGLS
ncbi:MAG: chemotaxis protein CheX [Turneriella sp.]